MPDAHEILTGEHSPLKALVPLELTPESSGDHPEVIALLNAVEAKIAALRIPTTGYTVGTLPTVASRTRRIDFPNWEDLTERGGIKRLLDKPYLSELLVKMTIEHVQKILKELVGTYPALKTGKAKLPHTINKQKHHQRARLLSYLMRAFCPDNTPAIFLQEDTEMNEDDIGYIIRNLPLDPAQLNDEVLKKMGLAPDDFDTYTLQARLKHKLWVRKHFFEILSKAHVFEADFGRGLTKSTARIIAFRNAHKELRVGAFVNESDLYIHTTGQTQPRKKRTRVTSTHFRVFEGFDVFLRSQEHALEKLTEKGNDIGVIQGFFEDVSEFDDEDKNELILQSLHYFLAKEGYYEKKLVEFLEKTLKDPTMIGHVKRVLAELFSDIQGKVHEIQAVYTLLKQQIEKHAQGKQSKTIAKST